MSTLANSSVDQVFDALAVLARSGQPVGVAELARELGLPTSTAHRLLVTLHDAGLAGRDSTGSKYELGLEANALARGLFRQFPLARCASPFLHRLAELSGETTTLDVRAGWLSVRMAGAEGWREIHAGIRLGQTLPLAESAAGVTVLALSTDGVVNEYLRWEKRRGRVASRARALGQELTVARERGYAQRVWPDGGGAQLAFPVRVDQHAIAAICLNGDGPAGSAPASDRKRWLAVVAELQELLRREPASACDPFAHIGADELTQIILASS